MLRLNFSKGENMPLFNDFEKELLDAARLVLAEGKTRLKSRISLLPSNRHTRAEKAALRGAKDAVTDMLINDIGASKHECAAIVLIDAQGRLIDIERLPDGEATSVAMRPRLIAKAVIDSGASYAVLAHNHPSGDCTPSKPDVDFTKGAVEFLRAIECELIDHLVITVNEAEAILGNW